MANASLCYTTYIPSPFHTWPMRHLKANPKLLIFNRRNFLGTSIVRIPPKSSQPLTQSLETLGEQLLPKKTSLVSQYTAQAFFCVWQEHGHLEGISKRPGELLTTPPARTQGLNRSTYSTCRCNDGPVAL